MKRLIALALLAGVSCQAQKPASITGGEAARIETMLAGDSMRGRRAGTPDADRAAEFIAAEFKKAGLRPMWNSSFIQTFSLLDLKPVSVSATMDGSPVAAADVFYYTAQPQLEIDERSGYDTLFIGAGEDLNGRIARLNGQHGNKIAFVDTSLASSFHRLSGRLRNLMKPEGNTVFVLSPRLPRAFHLSATTEVKEKRMSNVVGILPGRSRAAEYVVFSAHYDHLGVRPGNGVDSIYNGANDDASGTTAVILMANYFQRRANNERTLVFVAFTAEEIGGYGSRYFSKQLIPAKVAAMFNIEMIGTQSRWGADAAYITGYDKSNMGELLAKNLRGTRFHFYPDPYTSENLFYRSDNATLAQLGVPAHTISTAKMDEEPNYHKASDEVSTLDLSNMVHIINAIALSAHSIISGKDTPSRIKEPDGQNR